MNKISILSVAAAFLLLPFSAQSQEADLGNWLIYIGSKKIDSQWNWHHEVQYRNYNAIGDLEQLLLRTGIGYNVNDQANVLLGYGFINSQNYIAGTDEKVSINEHRIFQQLITKQKINRLGLQHRYRFEQRFVEKNDPKLRFRYFLGLNFPLNRKEIGSKTLYLSAYNEIFLNTKRGSVFDRNRLYGGFGYKVNANMKFEVGYMNQFLANRNSDQVNLVAFLNF